MPFKSKLSPIQLVVRENAIIRMRDYWDLDFIEIAQLFHVSKQLAYRIYTNNERSTGKSKKKKY